MGVDGPAFVSFLLDASGTGVPVPLPVGVGAAAALAVVPFVSVAEPGMLSEAFVAAAGVFVLGIVVSVDGVLLLQPVNTSGKARIESSAERE